MLPLCPIYFVIVFLSSLQWAVTHYFHSLFWCSSFPNLEWTPSLCIIFPFPWLHHVLWTPLLSGDRMSSNEIVSLRDLSFFYWDVFSRNPIVTLVITARLPYFMLSLSPIKPGFSFPSVEEIQDYSTWVHSVQWVILQSSCSLEKKGWPCLPGMMATDTCFLSWSRWPNKLISSVGRLTP